MKTLIIYLSATGNTERLAKEISNKIENVDLLPIILKTKVPKGKFWSIFKIGFLMSFNIGMKYSLSEIDPSRYNQIIIGSPVWMGKVAPPLLHVIKKFKLKNKIRSAFVTCGGGPGNVFEDLSKKANLEVLENKLIISDSENYDDPNVKEKIQNFIHNLKQS